MTVKSERITILGSPSFKAYLNREAKKEGVSISELVRSRCQKKVTDEDEQLLLELIKEVKLSTASAKRSLNKGIKDAQSVLKELRKT